MTIEFYDLCGTDSEIHFSPNTWRTRMALMHKNLTFDIIDWRFTEKEAIAFSGQGAVPVIRDNGKSVHDSWEIAKYLEETYPDQPSLFGGPDGLAGVTFFRHWVNTIYGLCAPLAVYPVWSLLDEKDQAYFRETREARLGKKLEDICGDTDARLTTLRNALGPMRSMLSEQPYAGGNSPLYSDHMLFGTLQWLRCVTPLDLFEEEDAMNGWMDRMLDSYGGHARKAKTVRDVA